MERDLINSALKVVEQLTQSPEPIGVREISRLLEMSPSAVHRLLQVLKRERLAVQVGERGLYSLGPRLSELASRMSKVDLIPIALPLLNSMVERSGESGSVVIAEGNEITCVASAECDQLLRVVFPLGYRGPIYQGASGKLLLAFQPAEVVQSSLREAKQKLGAAFSKHLSEQIETIRKNEFAISDGERQEGYFSVAAAVRDPDARVIAAVALYGPSARLGPEGLSTHLKHVQQCAAEIANALRLARAHRIGSTGISRQRVLRVAESEPIKPHKETSHESSNESAQ